MLPNPESRFLDTPALFVEARFRGRVVAARLLTSGTSRPFTIGAARRADAPVDPAFLPADAPANDNHALVAPSRAGFVLNLSPAMRARLDASSHGVRVPCGEVVFDIREAAPEVALPRPWLARRWRSELPYTLGAAAALLLVVALLAAVPSDPHALSLDDVGRTVRFDLARVIPPAPVVPPAIGGAATGGTSTPAAGGRAGAPGPRAAAHVREHRAERTPSTFRDAASAAEAVRQSPLLALLGATRRSEALRNVFARGGALGDEADDTLDHLVATSLERGYASNGSGPGTGARDAGTGEGTIGGDGTWSLNRIGGRADGPAYGRRAGLLHGLAHREGGGVQSVVTSPPSVRGGLDKEIVRRVVRQHLNEVRFCYSEALARQPTLAGRVVVQFTIAPTGRVIVAALQSTSLGAPNVEQCIVAATRRWEYPRPLGGGLVSVSYPFQLVPLGN